MSTESQSNNKRIAKNTLYMYLRMGITMLVQLYTSRVVLEYLGVENYGIYNVVGSFIVAFTFISGPLGTATQRFLTFELGKKEGVNINVIFNLSLYTYIFLSIALVIIIECAGLWYIENKMILPDGRLEAAYWAFHFSVISLVFQLFRSPFESLLVAYEKMSFYAYISIADVILKLANAFSLMFFACDKLKLYSVNQLVISIIVFIALFGFCKNSFPSVRISRISQAWDKKKFLEMLSFSGWSLFGSVASMTANQGLNILLNMFFGVVVNAAMGIATQINSAVNQFVSNFQIAFRPQLVKYYAAGELDQLRKLIFTTSKFSYLLLFAIVCPVCFNMQFLLDVWLKTPPEFSCEFCIFMLVYALLETLSAPMWMTVQATGKIKKYQITISSIIFLNIIFSYLFLKLGFSPVTVLIIKCCLDVVYLITRILFMKSMVSMSITEYIKKTLLPVFIVTILSICIMLFADSYIKDGWAHLFYSGLLFCAIYLPLVLFVGLLKNERTTIIAFVKSKIHH